MVNNTAEAGVSATFTLAESAEQIEVVEEGRTISLSGTTFSDLFGPYEVHVYEITNNSEPGVNQAPVAIAGLDQTITLPASADLVGTGTDDGLPDPPAALTATWTKVSGPGTVTFSDASAAQTKATFSVEGTYILRSTPRCGRARIRIPMHG